MCVPKACSAFGTVMQSVRAPEWCVLWLRAPEFWPHLSSSIVSIALLLCQLSSIIVAQMSVWSSRTSSILHITSSLHGCWQFVGWIF